MEKDLTLETFRTGGAVISGLCAAFTVFMNIRFRSQSEKESKKQKTVDSFMKNVLEYAAPKLAEFSNHIKEICESSNARINPSTMTADMVDEELQATVSSIQKEYYKLTNAIHVRIRLFMSKINITSFQEMKEKIDDEISESFWPQRGSTKFEDEIIQGLISKVEEMLIRLREQVSEAK